VRGLPVGLKQVVAREVTHHEDGEGLDPWHCARLPLSRRG
jgi:hypothetical protein